MKLQHIELDRLKISPVNVRKNGGKDVGDLIASIRSLGVIQPLLVRPNCEGYEVVSGSRRLRACQALAAEGDGMEPLPCAVLDSGDDATAIEASLAENSARLPMDELDQFEAFAALNKEGRSVEEIAAAFGVTERLVRQRLAIANLHPPILSAHRKGEVDAPTMRILTMATKSQQKAWFKRFRDPDDDEPTGRWLKAWLFGGAEIPVSAALFPLETYKGGIISDLFGEESYFDDPQAFWTLQMEAIAQARSRYLEDGWSGVEIGEIGAQFYTWEMASRTKEEGGRVYVACARNGEVEFHEGWLDAKEARRLDRAAAGAEGTGKAAPRSELTKAAIRYCDLHRHAAVRVELLKAPHIALRLIAAHIIAGSELWDVRPERQSANGNEAVAGSIEASKAQGAFADERRAVQALFGDCSHAGSDRDEIDTAFVFARLLKLPDEDVTRILTFAMAETLAAGTGLIEALGQLLSVDMAAWWEPDEAFFDLLRDKPALNAMVAEVAGKASAEANLASTGKVQKAVIRSCLAGTNGRKKAEGWLPRYMRFPMQGYTECGGLPAIEQWQAISELFAEAA